MKCIFCQSSLKLIKSDDGSILCCISCAKFENNLCYPTRIPRKPYRFYLYAHEDSFEPYELVARYSKDHYINLAFAGQGKRILIEVINDKTYNLTLPDDFSLPDNLTADGLLSIVNLYKVFQ